MKIVLTHPYCWPYVRRGTERFMAQLGQYLTCGGHTVSTVSSKPGPPAIERGSSGERRLVRQVWHPMLRRLRIHPGHAFCVSSCLQLRKLPADIVQSFHFTDAVGSAMAARRNGHRSVYYVTGPPIPYYQPRIPPDRWLLRQALRKMDLVLAPSRYVADIVSRYYDVDALVVPVPLNTTEFSPDRGARSKVPLILGMAAFDDPRKAGLQLIRAFALVKQRHADAILRLCGEVGAEKRRELLASVPPEVAQDVEFPGVGTLDDLPNHYRQAWVTVQPAKWEAYSMILLESWACGTPAVAVRHGGLPELVTDPSLGTLFDPGGTEDSVGVGNIEGLASAIGEALRVPVSDARSEACRQKAALYSWDRLGPCFLEIYNNLLKRPAGSRSRSPKMVESGN